MKHLTRLMVVAAALGCGTAQAQISDGVIKLGVLNDMSSLYADIGGKGSVLAAQMAADDVGAIPGARVEIVSADHQNKPDVGSAIARQWLDADHVDTIVDVPTSSVALAVQEVTREKKRIFLMSGPASSDLTGKNCSPYGFQWTYDTYALAKGTGGAIVKQGGDTWFFITADYAFGHALEADFRKAIEQMGGKTVGSVKHPVGMQDFSALILAAQASKAKGVVVASGGNDIVNTLKSANEFGLNKAGISFVAPATFLTDVKSMGLDIAQGLTYVTGFTWNYDDTSRAFARKFFARHKAMPTMGQAGAYSATRHYLRAVDAAKSLDAEKVAEKMREMPVSDAVIRNGTIRSDGRLVHEMYLVEVRRFGESNDPWDLEKVVDTLSGNDVFRPLSESDCPLIKK
jgi:branched-chain amino acid transport system substrate-binding protein